MKIGVIGAGTMGQGIAKAFAQVEGNTVVLCDIKQEWADNGKAKIAKGYDRLVAKGKMTKAKADEICAAITAGVKEDLCADCDLIVEAAFEDMKVKQTTFAELDKICKPECIFASNTSSLSITEIGKGLSRPLVGMHFFNPADRMKLIEVIAGGNTPVETVEKIKEISVAIGKQPVQVNEAAGFVVNRILIPMINEAAFIQRGRLHQDGGRVRHRGHRRRHEAGRQPPDGSPGAGRLCRPGHLPGHHGRAVQGDRRLEVPATWAARPARASMSTTLTAPRPRSTSCNLP